MEEIFTQIRNECPICFNNIGLFYLPYGEESMEKSKNFNPNQIVRNKVYGTTKQRSIKQLNLYKATCQYVANNTENPQWNTKKKVGFQCKVAAHLVDPNIVAVRPDKTVVFEYLSVGFATLKHLEACNFFNQAYDLMAAFIKMPVEELIAATQAEMKTQ